MSADNYLLITKDFVVLEGSASSDGPPTYVVARATTLEEAVKMAQRYQRENVVEYGISFDLEEPA